MILCVHCTLVGPSGLEPPTSCLSGTRSNLLSYDPIWLVVVIHLVGGDDGIRTHDPLLAGQVLSQLSYTPKRFVVVFSILPFIWKFLCLAFFSKKVSFRVESRFLCSHSVLALSYLPVPLPAKYFRHCRA